MNITRVLVAGLVCFAAVGAGSAYVPQASAPWAARELRAGIVGTDTSHVPQFTKILHSHPEWRIRVVAAFKGGSPDLPISATRVDKFAETIQKEHGVELVDSIETLLKKVDVVLLTTVDGRPHLAQATPILKAGKRTFIDKPLAASLEDARRIAELGKTTGTPFFSSSSLRFHPDLARLRADAGVGKVTRVEASYLLNIIEFHPDLYYYGIHGVEALYAVMGRGCVSLSRKTEGEHDVTTCRWKDGRTGVFRGLPKADPNRPLVIVEGEKGKAEAKAGGSGSEELAEEVAKFFHTGRPPVDIADTIEIFEFMTAAQLSKERGGAEVSLDELRKKQ